MKKSVLLFLGVCAAFAFPLSLSVGGHAASADEGKQVLALNRSLVAAVLKQDAPVLQKLMAENLLYVHGDGQLRGKKAFIDELGKGLTYKSIELSDEGVRVNGNLAVVSAKAAFHVFEHGGDARTVTQIVRVFEKNKGAWQLVLHQATRLPQPKK
jgi:ketosteroid isomerase-like protein